MALPKKLHLSNDAIDVDALRESDGDGDTPKKKSADELNRDRILAALDELGGRTVSEDALIFQGTQFVLPEQMRDNIPGAVRYLRDYEERLNTEYGFTRTFNYRPWDGAHAFQLAMKRVFGSTGIGVPTETLFGETPPQYITIPVGVNETTQVPWGRVRFSPLDATFGLLSTHDEEHGMIFAIIADAPRKHRQRIEGFLDVVEEELQRHSIYRGKAIDASERAQFLDTASVNPDKVVYTEDVETQLDANLWSLIEHSERMRKLEIPLKRTILAEGPYGGGKTLAGALTAQRAVKHGWTYILVRPGKDDLFDALRTARLYAPAVVWFEDIDTVARGEDRADVSKLLDALDGIQAKGVEVMAGFTTNFVERIEQGCLRPGRIDAVIHIGHLDREGFEKLIRVVIPPDVLDSDIDFDTVADAMEGFLPAFAREAAERAMRYSIARTGGDVDVVTTDDLVNASRGLRRQFEIMNNAPEASRQLTVDDRFRALAQGLLDDTAIVDGDGDEIGGGMRLRVGNSK